MRWHRQCECSTTAGRHRGEVDRVAVCGVVGSCHSRVRVSSCCFQLAGPYCFAQLSLTLLRSLYVLSPARSRAAIGTSPVTLSSNRLRAPYLLKRLVHSPVSSRRQHDSDFFTGCSVGLGSASVDSLSSGRWCWDVASAPDVRSLHADAWLVLPSSSLNSSFASTRQQRTEQQRCRSRVPSVSASDAHGGGYAVCC